jgi:crossover junction endodeoxyribonuclease RuvC
LKEPPAHEVIHEFLDRSGTGLGWHVVAIDPGAEGAMAIIAGSGNNYAVVDLPTLTVPRSGSTTARPLSKTVADLPGIVRLFRELDTCGQAKLLRVAVEQAQVQIKGAGANAYTGYRVGEWFGMWGLFFAEKGWPCETHHPASWKRQMGLSKDKEQVRAKAQQMFPAAPLSRKKDHNRAEALLLAEYHRRIICGQQGVSA